MRSLTVMVLLLALLAGTALAQESAEPSDSAGSPPTGRPAGPPGSPVSPTLSGGFVHQFATDLDDAGDFSVNRFFIQPGINVFFSPKLQASFSLGYSLDQYDFGGRKGVGAEPWEDVNTFRVTAFTRYVLDDTVTLFAAPAVQFAAEKGASLSDGFTYGMFAGASWKLSDSLTIGPGAGFFSDIEDSGVFFPFILIDWQLAENWWIRTGRGLAATRGPGLRLEWEFADQWSLAVGGRWEQLRFRLDDDVIAPDGVGEEQSVPLFLALSYELAERSSVGLLVGVNLYGSLSTFDERGRKLRSVDYDPAPFLGLAFMLTF
jgi:hypothetical protein